MTQDILMAQITITAAAQQGFKSRAQINKDVRSGKLTSTLERGRKVVDIADLVRLYGEPGGDPVLPGPEQAATEQDLETAQAAQARLEMELREAREALAAKDADAAKERDRLMGMVEQSNALLEDLRKDREELRSDRDKDREVMAELTQELQKPLWKRLFG
jgi:DNA repair exonuclease SbcCD ATPase subunit